MNFRITNLGRALVLVFFSISGIFCYSFSARASYLTSVSSQWTDVSGGIYYNTGNIGIGLTNPTGLLHVYSTASSTPGLFVGTNGLVGVGMINPTRAFSLKGVLGLVDAGDSERFYINPTTSGIDMVLRDSAGNFGIRFDSRNSGNSFINIGNVGIGTTAPTGKLEVAGTSVGGFIKTTIRNSDTTNGSTGAGIEFLPTTGSWGAALYTDRGTRGSLGGLYFSTSGAGSAFDVDKIKMMINQIGNVGIGTTAPGKQLEVAGTGQAKFNSFIYGVTPVGTDTLALATVEYVNSKSGGAGGVGAGTTGQTLRHDGTGWVANSTLFNNGTNVGIGTTAPNTKLQIANTSAATTTGQDVLKLTGVLSATAVGSGPVLRFTDSNGISNMGSVRGYTFGSGATGLAFETGWNANTVKMVIDNSGNVGVGTTNPVIGLQVEKDNGNGWAALFRRDATSNGVLIGSQGGVSTIAAINSALGSFQSLALNPAGGSVGIGTTTPGKLLHAAGQARFDSFAYGTTPVATDTLALATVEYVNSKSGGSGGVGAGTTGQTLRHDGTGWVANSTLYNNGANVGIGTTAPGNTLSVKGASGLRITNNTYDSNLVFGASDAWKSGIRVWDNGDAEMRIWHANANGQIILATGYNGDGATTTPTDGVFIDQNKVGIGYVSPSAATGKLLVNGNVGIGITNPSTKLSFGNPGADKDVVSIYQDSSGTAGIGTYGVAGVKLYSYNSGYDVAIGARTGPDALSTKLIIKGTGNIGIGTTTPGKLLQVAGQAKFDSFAYGTTPVATDTLALATVEYVNSKSGGSGGVGAGTTGQTLRHDGTGWVANSTLYNNGANVGVGTTNPTKKLHIKTNETGAGSSLFRLDNSGTANNEVGLDFFTSTLTGTNVNRAGRIYGVFDGDSYVNARLTLQSMTTGDTLVDTLSLKSGNVGIGTTTPTYKLDVNGTGRFASTLYLDSSSALNFSLGGGRIDQSANWVEWDINTGKIGYLSHNNVAKMSWNDANTVFSGNNVSINSGQLYVRNSDGYVGIGTTTPGKLLNVAGQAKFDSFAYGTTPIATDTLALTTVEYVNAKSGGAGGVSAGTTGQTLRHNGTGWVANSVLYNNGTNVGVGTTAPGVKFDVVGGAIRTDNQLISTVATGTAPLAVSSNTLVARLNADLLDNVQGSVYFKDNDVVMNTNPFGGRSLYINSINNAMFRAESRWVVTGNFYNSSNDALVGAIASANLANLFDGNYETTLTVPLNQYAVVNINFSTEAGGQYPGYPYGSFYLSHYYTYYPQAESMRVYCNYVPQVVGWKDLPISDFYNSGGANLITKADNGYYALSQVEFKITSPTSGNATAVSEIDWRLSRPGSNDMPLVDKYKPNSLFSPLYFKNSSNVNTVAFSPTGSSYFNVGNLGVGTNAPGKLLHVAGQAKFDSYAYGLTPVATDTLALATVEYVNAKSGGSGGVGTGITGQTLRHDGTGWVANSTLYNNGANVGIGATGPGAPLQIGSGTANGTILYRGLILSGGWSSTSVRQQNLITFKATDNVSADPFSDTSGETVKNWHLGLLSDLSYNTNSRFSIINQGNERLTIVNSGNVGIGTTNPGEKFVVKDVSGVTMRIGADGSNPAYAAGLIFTEDADNTWGSNDYGFRYFLNGSTNNLYLQSGAGATIRDIMAFDRDSGNVGFGTTTPGKLLHVAGQAKFDSYAYGLTPVATDTLALATVEYVNAKSGGAGGVGAGTTGQTLRHNGTSWIGDSTLYNNGTNVGVGTTNPGYRLDLNLASSTDRFRISNQGALRFYMTGDGVMGWGLNGASGSLTWDANKAIVRGLTNQALSLGANGGEHLYINTSGNVGIGLTNPSKKLEVSGNMAANSYSFNSSTKYSTEILTSLLTDNKQNIVFNNIFTAGESLYAGTIKIVARKRDTNAGPNGVLEKSFTFSIVSGAVTSLESNVDYVANSMSAVRIGEPFIDTDMYLKIPINSSGMGSGRGIYFDITVEGSAAWVSKLSNIAFSSSVADTFPGYSYPTLPARLGIGLGNNVMPVAPLQVTGSALFSSNVGIGTTAPGKLLHTAGQAKFDSYAYGLTPVATDTLALATVEYVNAKSGGSGGVGAGTTGQTLRHNGTGWVGDSNLFNNGTAIGIGTTTPGAKLHIYGEGATDMLKMTANYATPQVWTQYVDSGGWYLKQDSNLLLHVHSGGSVGIGTTTPGAKLHVNGGASTALIVSPEAGTGNIYLGSMSSYNFFSLNGDNSVGNYNLLSRASDKNLYINRPTGNLIQFRENNASQVTIASGGNVGVGVTNPAFNLQVYGSAANYNDGSIAVNPFGQVYPGIFGRFQKNNDTGGGGSYYTYLANDMYHTNTAAENSYYVYNQYVDGQAITMNSDGFKFWYANATADGQTVTAGELMRIASTGNVGIGTTAPGKLLQVAGQAKFDSYAYGLTPVATDTLALATVEYVNAKSGGSGGVGAGTTGQTLRHNGTGWIANSLLYNNGTNIGIGTTNPLVKLQIQDTNANYNSPTELLRLTRLGTTPASNIQDNSGGRILFQAQDKDANIRSVAYIDALYIDPDYNSVDVNERRSGDITFNNYYADTSFRESMRIKGSSGNVGIGTTTPTQKLLVNDGNIHINTPNNSAAGNGVRLNRPGATYAGFEIATNNVVDWSIGANSAGFGIYEDGQAATTRLLIKDGGNIGIGTTSPLSQLHMYKGASGATPYSNSQLIIENNARNIISLLAPDSADNYIMFGSPTASNRAFIGYQNPTYSGGADSFVFRTSGNFQFSGGNVGIGTTTPGKLLQVAGQAKFDSYAYGLTPVATDTLALATVEYVNSKSGGSGGVGAGTTGQTLRHNGTSWIGDSTLYNNGANIGIGTTDPAGKLHLSTISPDRTSVVDALLLENISTGGAPYQGHGQGIAFYGRTYPSSAQKALSRIYSVANDHSGSTAGTDLVFQNVTDNADASPSTKMIIKYSGNVGIGTTSPAAKLTVFGTDNKIRLAYDASNYSDIIVNSSGQMRFAPSSGSAYLYGSGVKNVLYTYDFSNSRTNYSALSSDYLTLQNTSNQATVFISASGGSYLSGGNVGIGTTTPGKLLQVAGQAKFDSYAYGLTPVSTDTLALATVEYVNAQSAGAVGSGTTGQTLRHNGTGWVANSLLYNNGTNIGVGTTAPTVALDVSGVVNALTGYRVAGAAAAQSYLRGNGTNFVSSAIQAGDVPTLNQNTSGYAGLLNYEDNRTISPSELAANRLKFGFTSYNNNNSSPYADFIHLRSYQDASGGNDNLLVFNKSTGFGMRLYQGAYGTTTVYTTYKDILLSDNSPVANYITKYTGAGTTVSVGKSVIYDNGTNVGIGTTAPGKLLQVAGQAKFDSYAYGLTPVATDTLALATVEYVNSKSGGSGGVGTGTTGQTLRNDGTGWVANSLLYNNGTNIGVGTTSPSHKLAVIGTGYISGLVGIGITDPGAQLEVGGIGVLLQNTGSIYWGHGDGTTYIKGDATAGTGSIKFGTANSDRLTILNGGNVGIGTTAPGSLLQVGNDATNPTLILESTSTGDDTTVQSAGIEFGEVPSARGSIWYTGNGYMHIGMNNRAREHMRFQYDAVNTWMYGNIYFPGSGIWNSSGNIGVGTTNPQYRLDMPIGNKIGSYADATHNASIEFYNSTTANMNFQMANVSGGSYTFSGGNVGIGTTAPSKLLHVAGQAKFDSYAYGLTPVATDTLALATVEYVNSKSGGSGGVGTGTAGQTLRNNGTGWVANSLLYNNGTNIGIGTTSPSFKLDVAGIVNATALYVNGTPYIGSQWTTNGTSVYYNSGNVGIGVTGPVYKLEVSGNSRFLGGTAVAGTFNATADNQLLLQSSDTWTGISFDDSGATNDYIWYNGANGTFAIGGGGSNVASKKLHINGGTTIGSSYSATAVSANGLRVEGQSWFTDNVGIGTTAPSKLLQVAGSAKFDNYAYGTTPVATDTLALATVEYVNARAAGGSFLPLAGGTMTGDLTMSNGANINMGGGDILNVDKLTVNTIDPLYKIKGINYSTYAASISGGVKEEYVGKIMINDKITAQEYETIVDFSRVEEGSDLWVWRSVVDFSKNNVEVLVTPYGRLAQVYYIIEGNKLIFRSDRATEISYRLIGKRFDWRKWPTRAIDQTERGMEIK